MICFECFVLQFTNNRNARRFVHSIRGVAAKTARGTKRVDWAALLDETGAWMVALEDGDLLFLSQQDFDSMMVKAA